MNQFFDLVIGIFVSLFRFIRDIWSACGDFQPIFIAIFISLAVFNFIVVPMLVFRRKS